MKWGSLLVLAGLLALWAGLQPASGKLVPDICRLPPDRGPCKLHLKRYYFDWVSGSCQTFTYGGCRGNGNRFWSLRSCRKKCQVGGKGLEAARGIAAPGQWLETRGSLMLGRPSRCPPPKGAGICVQMCDFQRPCPPGHFCCGTGCGTVCRSVKQRGQP
ncbi:kunitz-type serine protease inhibitor bitisilin-1-like [Alligator mississippiensis]|uniref:kunitz-type serine protease inhibitor bitisilin-1-like n=1 Tax=Alligator mississippiensis TaxID=8496 RepID=UPI0028778C51|nr:kunitz-type serine protease inhibitor bitisilin-1-like [Alligator mississippiensis]